MRDLKGQRFGLLTVVDVAGKTKSGNYKWNCICECGNKFVAVSGKLIKGRTTNCGCRTSYLKSKNASKHGLLKGKKPRIFTIWCGMKSRCTNEKANNYHRYGGRGISVCSDWMIYENFYKWAVECGYEDSLTIDRIDNDGNYCPENCRWIPLELNKRLQSRYTLLTVNGVKLPLGTFANKIGKDRSTLRRIYNKHGKEYTEAFVNKFLQHIPV